MIRASALALIVATVCMSLTGCAMLRPGESKETTCTTAAAALGAYHAVIAAGQQPSQGQIQAAAGATAFLSIWCGWTESRGADANGVPIIIPPAE